MESKPAPQPALAPWYAQGLRFACQGCGQCCGGGPGYVWIDEREMAAMADFLGLPAEAFRRLWRGLSLREKPNYDCVLLDGNRRCTAYDVRPLQCRIWPFWPSNLRDPQTWDAAAQRCPGIGRGPLFYGEQIETLCREMKE